MRHVHFGWKMQIFKMPLQGFWLDLYTPFNLTSIPTTEQRDVKIFSILGWLIVCFRVIALGSPNCKTKNPSADMINASPPENFPLLHTCEGPLLAQIIQFSWESPMKMEDALAEQARSYWVSIPKPKPWAKLIHGPQWSWRSESSWPTPFAPSGPVSYIPF